MYLYASKLFCRPKVVKQLRFDARKELESEKSARKMPKEEVITHSEVENEKKFANYPQNHKQEAKRKSPSMNRVNSSVQDKLMK